MVYFTVYLKNLNNGSGYVDTALADDQLMRDYLQYLDIGVKAHKAYAVVDGANHDAPVGVFAVNLADVAAITATVPRQEVQPTSSMRRRLRLLRPLRKPRPRLRWLSQLHRHSKVG